MMIKLMMVLLLLVIVTSVSVAEQGPLLPSQRAGIAMGTQQYQAWLAGAYPGDYGRTSTMSTIRRAAAPTMCIWVGNPL